MKRISRREFVRLCAGSAAGVSVLSLLGPYIASAFGQAAEGKPVVLWLQGASCTGCSVSLLNSVEPGSPTIDKLLLDVIALKYHHNVMAASGQLAMDHLFDTAETNKGKFFLVVEGGVPAKDDGYYCTIGDKNGKHITMLNAVREIGGKAAAVIAAGTCAAYGGIPAGGPNPTGVVGVKQILSAKPVINIPNCPMHPDAFLGTVTYVLTYGDIPALDAHGRPTMFYGRTVHDNCIRRSDFFAERFAQKLGDPGCLYLLGCKGPLAYSDCANRGWNNNTSWCVKAGAPCMACAEPGFPDAFSPFYGRMPLNLDFELVAK
ncbi:MAG: hydrogenase small subunit [Candidatus Desulforudis sp.]|nr:hydrogenase small subunit [Desulforudis sp.]